MVLSLLLCLSKFSLLQVVFKNELAQRVGKKSESTGIHFKKSALTIFNFIIAS